MAKPRQLASLAKEAIEAAKFSTKNLRVTTNRPAPRKAIYAGLSSISAFNKYHVANIYQIMSRLKKYRDQELEELTTTLQLTKKR